MNLDVYFDKLHITSLVELGQNMYLYPDLAYSLIIRSDFQLQLKEENPSIYTKFENLKNIMDDEEFLFKVSYLFCPYMSLRYHGYKFDNLQSLGEKIINFGPVVDVYLMDLIKFKLLSYVYELQDLHTISPEDYQAIKKAENEFNINPYRAYFTLGFELSRSKVIVYYGRPYANPKIFFESMTSQSYIKIFAKDFEQNEYLFAWLNYLNYKKRLKRFKNLVKFLEEREKL